MKNRQPREHYWRAFLECGGLTPLSFCASFSVSQRGCWESKEGRRHSQSGVKPPHSKKAGGFLMFAALVCIALTVALVGLIARMTVVDMQYDRARLWNMQCQWLAEAGVQRAAARIAANPDFAGENWHVGPEYLDGRHAGVVRIAVVAPTEQPAERTISVQADFPDDPHVRVRHTRVVRLLGHNTQAYRKEEP